VLLAIPFLQENPLGYASRAFELTRQFLFEWTVNWRFIGEETFGSTPFAVNLLLIHVFLLLIFLTARWVQPSGLEVDAFARKFLEGRLPRITLSNQFVTTTLLTSLAIGLLCARSLHYQFFAYLAWTTPFLLWQARLHPVLIYAVWAVQEWAWNVFPSTKSSSAAVVLCLTIQVFGILMRTEDEGVGSSAKEEDPKEQHLKSS
jgi:alpha-1,3-mannosyltransferase